MASRVIFLLIMLLCLSLGAAYFFFREANVNTLEYEVGKALLQVGVVAIAGAVISLLTFEYQQERRDEEKARDEKHDELLRERNFKLQQTEKVKDSERTALEYQRNLHLSTLKSVMHAYVRIKKARRLLRARARIVVASEKMILAEHYDAYLDWINDAQLDLENIARDIETSASAFAHPIALRDNIRTIERYLNGIITEYEKMRCEFIEADQALSISSFPALSTFLSKDKESGFQTDVVIPYHEVQKGLREELLLPSYKDADRKHSAIPS
jgi:hypothetical protein